MSDFEDFENIDYRLGDERADSRIGDFKVFGGSAADRQRLQNGDEDLLAELGIELDNMLDVYDAETRPDLG